VTISGEELLQRILQQAPQLRPIADSIVLAVDQEYAQPSQVFDCRSLKEVAIIPPLSGG